MTETIKNGYMFHVKIYYYNGKHKYANIFELADYEMGLKLKTITGYRKMNRFEKFFF